VAADPAAVADAVAADLEAPARLVRVDRGRAGRELLPEDPAGLAPAVVGEDLGRQAAPAAVEEAS